MGWIKDLFKAKEKVPEVPKLDENREIRGYCSMCGKVIEIGEGYTKLLGKYYHRPCWKQMKKEGW